MVSALVTFGLASSLVAGEFNVKGKGLGDYKAFAYGSLCCQHESPERPSRKLTSAFFGLAGRAGTPSCSRWHCTGTFGDRLPW